MQLHIFYVLRSKQQDLFNLLGATYSAVLFLGGSNASAVQPVVTVERTVFYRERAAGMYSELPYAFAQVRALEALKTCYMSLYYASFKYHNIYIFLLYLYLLRTGGY